MSVSIEDFAAKFPGKLTYRCNFKKAALTLISRGFKVFPLREREKTPLTLHGLLEASCDAGQIESWAAKHPNANVGISTEGFPTLDVDARHNGHVSLATLVAANVPLPTTLVSETGGGGQHWIYKAPPGISIRNSEGKLGPGLDIRADGGYIAAPPSVHPSGAPYKWINRIPPVELSGWLLEKLLKLAAPPSLPTLHTNGEPGVILQGQGRHREILKVAGALRRQGLGPDVILTALVPINTARCVPPLELSELERLARYISTKPAGTFSRYGTTETTSEVELQYYHHVDREQVRWLWLHRIPRGKLTLFVGDPGTGKSLATIDLAARVSTGRVFPDGCPCEQGNVLILTAEDDARDTVGPRLDAAGADSSHVARINAVKVTLADGATGESLFSLERDLAKLQETLKKHADFKLIIIDPLTAYMGVKVNSWRDAEVRSLLAPLTDFAGETAVATVGIMHMRKSETDAMLRVSGSIAFVAAARTVWGFGEDPEDATKRVMVPVKNNLAALGNALGYQITSNGAGIPFIAWQKEPRIVDAEDVLGGTKKEKRARGEKRSEAEEWLKAQLADGPAPEKQLSDAAEKEGIAWRTLNRAKSRLRVRSHKAGMGGGWYWELPEACHEEGQHDTP